VLVARLTELLRELRAIRHDGPPWLEASLIRAVEGVGDSPTTLVCAPGSRPIGPGHTDDGRR